MLPELFRIPFLNLPIHTYGALYVAALIAGLFVAYRQALIGKKYYKDVVDFGFYALAGALLGARILFIIVESHYYFVDEPFTKLSFIGISIPTIFAIWKGGFVFWGGAVGGTIALYIFCKKRGIPVFEFADYCAPGLAIGHAIGRIGCVASGCCFGYATYHLDNTGKVIADTPWAEAYPPGSIAYGSLYNEAGEQMRELMNTLGTTVPLFPVQIMESLGNMAIFLVLMMVIPMKRAHGQIVLLYLILYSIVRSIAEAFRGDTARGFIIDDLLSTSQFISIIISSLAFVLIIWLSRKRDQHSVSV